MTSSISAFVDPIRNSPAGIYTCTMPSLAEIFVEIDPKSTVGREVVGVIAGDATTAGKSGQGRG